MRGVVVSSIGSAEVRDDLSTPSLLKNEVLVRMRASGVCRTDLSARNGVWPTRLPVVLGHEGAGEISEVGRDVVGLHPGDRVILAGLRGCGGCFHCVRGENYLCKLRDMTGSGRGNFLVGGAPGYGMVGLGAWAEHVVVPSHYVVPFSGDDIPWELASLINCAVMTGVGGVVNTAKVSPGSTVVIIGGGGVGAAAVQGARMCGASTVLVVDLVRAKLDRMKGFGATHVATPDELANLVVDLTAGRGFDFALEFVGRPESIRSAWDSTRRGGTVVLSGIGSRQTTSPLNLYEMVMDGKTLIGSVGGSVVPLRDFPLYLDLWRNGRLDLDGLVTDRIRLENAPEAMDTLDAGKDVLRQVIIFD